jgi:hypothetical protein
MFPGTAVRQVGTSMQRVHEWVGRKDRLAVEIEAVAHRTDGSSTPVKLTDCSDEGCRVEMVGDFEIGEHVQIAIPRMGHIKAQVRWALPGSAGMRFITESDF